VKGKRGEAIERPAIVWYRAAGEAVEYGIWPERPVTIGRETTNTIVIDSPFVSKAHALLQFRNGTYVLEDLGSANGTRVNGRPIDVASIDAGDTIEFGDERLEFVDRAAAPAEAARGLSKGTKLMLVAGGTGVVMIGGLALLLVAISPATATRADRTKAREPATPAAAGDAPSAPASALVPDVIKRAQRAGVKPADALYDEALVQYRVGRLKESRDLLRAVVAMDPAHELAGNRLRAVEGQLSQSIANYGGEAERAYAQLRYDAAIANWEQVLLLTEPQDARNAAAQQGISRARARMSR
jgi:predicted component of type VI protein secretion system